MIGKRVCHKTPVISNWFLAVQHHGYRQRWLLVDPFVFQPVKTIFVVVYRYFPGFVKNAMSGFRFLYVIKSAIKPDQFVQPPVLPNHPCKRLTAPAFSFHDIPRNAYIHAGAGGKYIAEVTKADAIRIDK